MGSYSNIPRAIFYLLKGECILYLKFQGLGLRALGQVQLETRLVVASASIVATATVDEETLAADIGSPK